MPLLPHWRGSVVPYTFIEGPQAWYAPDQLARQDEWLHVLSAGQVAELEAAVESALARGLAKLDAAGEALSVVGGVLVWLTVWVRVWL